jgi:putative tricarboxylic transport membrane protein
VAARVAGIGFAVLGVLVGLGAIHLKVGGWHSPGPGFFPLWIGVGMVVLGSLLALSRSERTYVHSELRGKKLVWAVFLFMGYALILERLGFLLTTLVFIPLWLRFIEQSSWVEIVVMTVASAATIYAVFVRWLQVPLPAGVLGW